MLMSISTFGQVKPFTSVEFGYEDYVCDITDYMQHYYGTLQNSMITEIFIGVRVKGLEIYTGSKVYFKPLNLISYHPSYQTYTLGSTYTLNKHVKFKVEHMCGHSIENNNYSNAYTTATVKISY